MRAGVTGAARLLGRAGRRAVDPRISTPSFWYKTEEARRLQAIERELGLQHPVWSINDKDAARDWAERMGLRQPRLVGQYAGVGSVPWDELPDGVVVKPVKGAGGRGVRLLRREGTGWRELRTQALLEKAELEHGLRRATSHPEVSDALVAEELVDDARRPGRQPVDWKVVTFFGRVGVVQAKAARLDAEGRPSAGWRFFDEHWNDLGRARSWRQVDPSIERPAHAEQLLETARRVSAAVPWPMLRVDLYDGAEGVVFGEITPEPGGAQWFRRDLDRWLGELWEEAEARLQVRAAAARVLTPAVESLPESAAVLERSGER